MFVVMNYSYLLNVAAEKLSSKKIKYTLYVLFDLNNKTFPAHVTSTMILIKSFCVSKLHKFHVIKNIFGKE